MHPLHKLFAFSGFWDSVPIVHFCLAAHSSCSTCPVCAGSCHDPVMSRVEHSNLSLSLSHTGACCHGNAQSAALWVSRSQKWWCFCNIEVNISLFPYLAYPPLSESTSSFWHQSPLAPCMKADGSRHRERAWPLEPGSCGLEPCLWQW